VECLHVVPHQRIDQAMETSDCSTTYVITVIRPQNLELSGINCAVEISKCTSTVRLYEIAPSVLYFFHNYIWLANFFVA